MNVFQINSHDNVAVAVDAVAKGSVVTAGGKTFTPLFASSRVSPPSMC